jgi:hypothetical protein
MRFGSTALAAVLLLATPTQGQAPQAPSPAGPAAPEIVFTDVTRDSGLHFVHERAATEEKYLVETMGGGCGWLDFDQDGWLDAFLVNSGSTPLFQPPEPLRHGLFRNNGDGTFTDVTQGSGVARTDSFNMGMSVGDYNNDGYPDLYVTGFPRSFLFRNNRDGTFADVTAEAGVSNEGRWGTSSGWFDYNKDGFLDLLVANYVTYSYDNNIFCGERRPGYRAYCTPQYYPGSSPRLYRNNGDGSFSDVTEPAGLLNTDGKGLGVVLFDYDNDGWVDILIANDGERNFLYRNRGDGTFEDETLLSGIGYSEDGQTEAGMGVDAADYDGDGWLDAYITHLDLELDRLYRNNGDGTFLDVTRQEGVGQPTILYSGFGTRFFDYDNDGWKDLFVTNGHILDNIPLFHSQVTYAEPRVMYRNLGGKFVAVSGQLGPAFRKNVVGRGAAVADFDNDGDLDILQCNNGESAELLRNDGGNQNHWIAVRLIGAESSRDPIGAQVRLAVNNFIQYDQLKGGMSYLAAQDPRLYFGLADATGVDWIEITWPSGLVQKFENLLADQLLTIEEGKAILPEKDGNRGSVSRKR